MIETWKDVVGFEGIYQVSDLGRVKSLQRVVIVQHTSGSREKPVRERIMKPHEGVGCMHVNLNPGGVKKKVHHLVLEAFVGERPEGFVTRHLNGDHSDNRLSNIIYGTQTENRFDAVRHDRHRVKRRDVAAIRSETNLSQRQMAKKYGVSRTYVRLVRSGKTRAEDRYCLEASV